MALFAEKLRFVEGEELVGAKQNRIVNATFLVAGNTEIVIPVSCVEQGRWHYASHEFTSGKKMMHASLRRNHQADVKFSLNRGEGYRSNQGRIWEDIEGKLDRMQVASDTAALSDAYESYKERLSGYLEKFSVMEWQCGAVFAINGRVLGLGPEAYVVEPEELREMIQADLKRSLDQYTEGRAFQVKEPVDGFADVKERSNK